MNWNWLFWKKIDAGLPETNTKTQMPEAATPATELKEELVDSYCVPCLLTLKYVHPGRKPGDPLLIDKTKLEVKIQYTNAMPEAGIIISQAMKSNDFYRAQFTWSPLPESSKLELAEEGSGENADGSL